MNEIYGVGNADFKVFCDRQSFRALTILSHCPEVIGQSDGSETAFKICGDERKPYGAGVSGA
jgi:hypothetical protein